MAIYIAGSECGGRVKPGRSGNGRPGPSRMEANGRGYYGMKYPHLLMYWTTEGMNDHALEKRLIDDLLKMQGRSGDSDDDPETQRYGRESFKWEDVEAWIQGVWRKWFVVRDAAGLIEADGRCVTYEEFAPSLVSAAYDNYELLERTGETPWSFRLPDTRIDADEDFYIIDKYSNAIHETFGGLDLDVASHPSANYYVKADRYIMKSENALVQPWRARNLFWNPPSNDPQWATRLEETILFGDCEEVIGLVGSRKLQSKHINGVYKKASMICQVIGGGPVFNGKKGTGAKATSKKKGKRKDQVSPDRWVFFYVGKNTDKFYDAFKHLGRCARLLP